MNTPKLFLLDGMALIFRSYHALRMSPRYTSYQKNTNAQFGFLNTLLELIKKNRPTHLAVAFDSQGSTQRHEIYQDYKANREATPEDILKAIPDIREILLAMNIPLFELPGYEADDIIGTITKHASKQGMYCYMVTMDKDYIQLVNESVFLYQLPRAKNPAQILGSEELCKNWGLKYPQQIIDILALMGDAVDNIPGVRGIGQKTAQKLVEKYGSVEKIIEQVEQIEGKVGIALREDLDKLKISKTIATINLDVPIEIDFASMQVQPWNMSELANILQRLEFRTIAKRIFPSAPILNMKPLEELASEVQMLCYSDLPAVDNLVRSLDDSQILFVHFAKVGAFNYPWIIVFRAEKSAFLHCLMYHDLISKFPDEKAELHQKMRILFENSNRKWVGLDLKTIIRSLHNQEINLQGSLFDLKLGMHLLDSIDNKNIYSQAQQYLGYSGKYFEYADLGKKGIPDWACWQAYITEYMDILARLYPVLLQKLQSECSDLWKLFTEVEMPLLHILAAMERRGIRVDVNFLSQYSQELASLIQQEGKIIYQITGQYFNIASPKQLGEILFNTLQLKNPSTKSGEPKKTKTGQFVTDEETLNKMESQHPVIKHIICYRELSKIKSTYADGLLEQTQEGCIHTTFIPTGALTGRLASQQPNLQNIPIRTPLGREIRRAFVPRGGYKLLCADYSQIELRIMAALSGDKNMIDDFCARRDIHVATASRVFGIAEEQVNKDMRRKAKGVNFGILYGQTAFGLARELNISKVEAESLIQQYFQRYTGIANYIEKEKQRMQKDPWVRTLGGRRRHLLNINSANSILRNAEERMAINMPIQGTAADMIKMAMVVIVDKIKLKQMRSTLLLQVHDELVFEMALDEEEELKNIILSGMRSVLPLPNRVPIEIEIGVANNWLEAH